MIIQKTNNGVSLEYDLLNYTSETCHVLVWVNLTKLLSDFSNDFVNKRFCFLHNRFIRTWLWTKRTYSQRCLIERKETNFSLVFFDGCFSESLDLRILSFFDEVPQELVHFPWHHSPLDLEVKALDVVVWTDNARVFELSSFDEHLIMEEIWGLEDCTDPLPNAEKNVSGARRLGISFVFESFLDQLLKPLWVGDNAFVWRDVFFDCRVFLKCIIIENSGIDTPHCSEEDVLTLNQIPDRSKNLLMAVTRNGDVLQNFPVLQLTILYGFLP